VAVLTLASQMRPLGNSQGEFSGNTQLTELKFRVRFGQSLVYKSDKRVGWPAIDFVVRFILKFFAVLIL
jgi:hypothetical protein